MDYPIHVGLTLLCKDEIDIIKQWVDYHKDRFYLTLIQDNGSTDGTYEYLETLRSSRVCVMSLPDQVYRQAEWVYDLDVYLINCSTSWAVNLDADEFLEGDVQAACERASEAGINQLYPMGTFMRSTEADDRTEKDPIKRMLYHDSWDTKYSNDKAIVNLKGLTGICQGNHWGFWDCPVVTAYDPSLRLRHYEQRSPEQFCKKYRGVWCEEKLKNMGYGWQQLNKLWLEGGDPALIQYFNEHALVSKEDIITRGLTKL